MITLNGNISGTLIINPKKLSFRNKAIMKYDPIYQGYNVGMFKIWKLNEIKEIHTNNIIHRDIQPNNILLEVNFDNSLNNAVIGDFGFARILIDSTAITTINSRHKSPEMVLPEYKNEHTLKTDIWSYGMLLYYIIFIK